MHVKGLLPVDPFGRDYYWFSGKFKVVDDDPDSDDTALMNGFISVTPVNFNFTNEKYMSVIKRFEKITL